MALLWISWLSFVYAFVMKQKLRSRLRTTKDQLIPKFHQKRWKKQKEAFIAMPSVCNLRRRCFLGFFRISTKKLLPKYAESCFFLVGILQHSKLNGMSFNELRLGIDTIITTFRDDDNLIFYFLNREKLFKNYINSVECLISNAPLKENSYKRPMVYTILWFKKN